MLPIRTLLGIPLNFNLLPYGSDALYFQYSDKINELLKLKMSKVAIAKALGVSTKVIYNAINVRT